MLPIYQVFRTVHLIPRYAGKLFSERGRTWLDTQPLPEDQRRLIGRHIDEHDRIAVELPKTLWVTNE